MAPPSVSWRIAWPLLGPNISLSQLHLAFITSLRKEADFHKQIVIFLYQASLQSQDAMRNKIQFEVKRL